MNGKWDILIAHPPCTYLSNAGACRLYPHKGQLDLIRFQKGLEAKKFFMTLFTADCYKIAVENPVPSKVFEMIPHTQEIQPWQFGRKDRSKYGAAKRGEDAKNRAKTFPGIARAMAEQWGGEA